jgi:hypothetical protein
MTRRFRMLGVFTAVAAFSGCAPRTESPVIVPFLASEVAGTGWTVLSPFNQIQTGQRMIVDRVPIRGAAVALVTGNRLTQVGVVTLTVASPAGQIRARVAQSLTVGIEGWVHFQFPKGGLDVSPGSEVILWLANSDREIFGWRYSANSANQGRAVILGRNDSRFDFLYTLEY